MHYDFTPRGVCSVHIAFDLNDGIIHNLQFTGGCNGNLKAISKLCENKKADEIAEILQGNTCGWKNTSCADQLSIALKQALNSKQA